MKSIEEIRVENNVKNKTMETLFVIHCSLHVRVGLNLFLNLKQNSSEPLIEP